PAVVRTAQETIGISVSGGATAELPTSPARTPSDASPARFLTKRKSSKSIALASTTNITVASDGSVEEAKPEAEPTPEPAPTPAPAPAADAPLPPEPPKPDVANTWGWTSWWSRPDGYTEAAKAKSAGQASVQDASSTPLPGTTPSEEPDAAAKGLDSALETDADKDKKDQEGQEGQEGQDKAQNKVDSPAVRPENPDTKDTSKPTARNSSGSWFWLWSNAQNVQANSPPPQQPASEFFTPNTYSDQATELAQDIVPKDVVPKDTAPKDTAPQGVTETPQDVPQPPAETSTDQPPPQTPAKTPAKASGWAFWYRDPASAQHAEGEAQKHVGEVAVFDTPSQSHPEAAQFNEQEQPKADAPEPKPKPKPKANESLVKKSLGSLRGRTRKAATKDLASEPADTASAPATPTRSSPEREPTLPPAATPAPAAKKQDPPNLILPDFASTYRLAQQPSLWKQVRRYFLASEPASAHLSLNPTPPRIRKAVAIGVHGFFPAPIFQRIMGQPTGTSIRFANAAAAAIKDWSEARGYCPEIEQVALEGEGFVAERVNTLWKLLLNWIDHLKAADFILVACHSQGVPVATMLVAKLIQFGCVGGARIGVCAMAGVNMGPFIEYKTKYFGPTAAELFEFSNPDSLVSQMYLAALNEVLRAGVHVLYVGSIDDQLVSLESSTFTPLTHPHIHRAVFIDTRLHAPSFLTHLVSLALTLRNRGLPDHNLLRELSPALAGSLYAGDGHSRVYEDPAVYMLAVRCALETTSLPAAPAQRPGSSGSFAGISVPVVGAPSSPTPTKPPSKSPPSSSSLALDPHSLRISSYPPPPPATPNPFFLPWAMRGLLAEASGAADLESEVAELLGAFEEWRPVGKGLKEVKWRLEGVRSRL
ncbi:hypothetical protein C7974DRAFT_274970, partial [Boeremia exigua]|uniref:uncharacterized protein n=1 Tax=Boeremia exigua TaxID=749465 RepID=UPI001E8EA56A